MQEDNKTPLTTVPEPPAAAPSEADSAPAAEQREPNEIVSWYVRPDEEGQEVCGCYVQPRPLPAAVTPAAPAARPALHSRRWLWVFLTVMAVLMGVVLALAVISAVQGGSSDDWADDDHNASSIVDISHSNIPTIPRAEPDPEQRFYCTRPEGEALTIQQVYAAVNPATVLVAAELGEKASIGTGVILTEDGYIVTNAHVISGGKSVLVVLDDNRRYEAELVGFDSGEDLALLKAVDAAGLPTAPLGDSDACQVGDTVYAIGNPLGTELRGTLTNGIISAIDRQVTLEGRLMTLLQTTAALNSGNSGGPLINEYGQVIGINTMKMTQRGSSSDTASVESLGFAVPAGQVVSVINDIVATGAFHGLPSIGVNVIETTFDDGTTHPVVDSVTENYGAEAAGLLRGDVILAADGVEICRNSDLLSVRRTHIAGETIILTVQRGDEIFDTEVYLYPTEG